MRPGVPSLRELERIVAAGARAPSAENCQPFHFRWDGAVLEVLHDRERARVAIDPDHHASCIALGAVLESLAVAADALGFIAEDDVDVGDPQGRRWARVRFRPGATGIGALARAIERRATDRRWFHGGTVSHPVFAQVRAEATRRPDCGVHVLAAPPPALLDFAARAEAYVWRDEAVFRDVMRWLRVTQREVEETRDGVSWRVLAPALPELSLARRVRGPGARGVLAALGAPRAAGLYLKRLFASSAALVLFTVRSRRREDLVAVGRALLAAWLHLTEADFGVHPHSQQSLFLYGEALGRLPPEVPAEFPALWRAGRAILGDAFALDAEELPALLVRTGLSPSLPAHRRTLRRSLAEILVVDQRG